jgi:hypothetical protein
MADRRYRWQDVSPRSPGERLPQPTVLRIEGDTLSIRIHESNGDWLINCYGLELYGVLDAKTPRAAQIDAVEMVQTKLERMMADLHLMKGAPHVG